VIRVTTKSADDTRELAAHLSSVARAGDVVLLSGELGAGKTTFTQGFGAGLGVAGPITSPTFTLMQIYPGRLKLVHVDVYRLELLQEVIDLGLPELLDDAVALVEWGEAAAPALPPEFLRIRFEFAAGDDDRVMTIEPVGRSWMDRKLSLEKWAA
jgi:tRNA threonylcarbamoyladenosine biosynthesis protein TsaE